MALPINPERAQSWLALVMQALDSRVASLLLALTFGGIAWWSAHAEIDRLHLVQKELFLKLEAAYAQHVVLAQRAGACPPAP